MILLIFLLPFVGQCYGRFNPVFIIDYSGILDNMIVPSKPLYVNYESQFKNILQEIAKRSTDFVIFIEEDLASEDVSAKTRDGTPFSNLHKALYQGKVKYLPIVENPYNILLNMLEQQPEATFSNISLSNLYSTFDMLGNNTAKNIYFYLSKEAESESRTEMLTHHDYIIKEIYYYLRVTNKKDFIGIYTGKKNSLSNKNMKHVRYVEFEPQLDGTEDEVFVSSYQMLMHLQGIFYKSALRSPQTEIPYVAEDIYDVNTKYSTQLTFSDFEIRFDFDFLKDFWRLDSVHLLEGHEVVGSLRMGVGAPIGYCFYCKTDPIVLLNSRDGSTVIINKYYLYPNFGPHGQDALRTLPKIVTLHDPDIDLYFRSSGNCPSVNCGSYFSAVILSVLFVCFILLSIFLTGITALMNVRTNDMFDDPHGKQLQMHIEL